MSEYRKRNIMNFWNQIQTMFTIVNVREFVSCKKRVENWCKQEMNFTIEKKMSFEIVEQISEFRNRLQKFVQRWQKIKKVDEFEKKSQNEKIFELRKNVIMQKQFRYDMQIRSNEEFDLIENEKRISTFDNVVIAVFSNKQKRMLRACLTDKSDK